MKEEYFTKENIEKKSLEIKNSAIKYSKDISFSINNKNTVLLVTDMQDFFLDHKSHAFIPSASAIISRINSLIYICEENNIPIILSQHINNNENAGMMGVKWRDIIHKNNPLCRISDKIKCSYPIKITKPQYDAFYKTNLENYLQKHNKDQLIICGVMTNLCCETTARSAFVRNFEVFMPIDTTAAYNLNFHLATIQNLAYGFCQPTLSSEIINAIKK